MILPLHQLVRARTRFSGTANVLMLVYGDAFWPTYTTGDNTGLVATDSMKNFIHRETVEFSGDDLDRGIAIFSRRSQAHGASEWTRDDVLPPARYRLYRATAAEHSVLGPQDRRTSVTIGASRPKS